MAAAATTARMALAKLYAQAAPAGVAAVVVGGSTGRGEADAHSDLDLLVCWRQAPTADERTAWIEAAGGSVQRLLRLDEERLWFDDWVSWSGEQQGIAAEVAHFTVEVLEERISALVERFDTDLGVHVVLGQLVHGVPLVGAGLATRWRERLATYPGNLAREMVERHGQIDHFWRLQVLRERSNPVLWTAQVADVQQRVLHTLLAVNRIYFFGFKFLAEVAAVLAVAPPGLLERLRRAYDGAMSDAEAELAVLVEETYDLVETHVPGADVDRLRRIFRYRRPVDAG